MSIPSFSGWPTRCLGYWCIGGVYGLRIQTVRRPRRLTRWLCRWLLEWEWREYE